MRRFEDYPNLRHDVAKAIFKAWNGDKWRYAAAQYRRLAYLAAEAAGRILDNEEEVNVQDKNTITEGSVWRNESYGERTVRAFNDGLHPNVVMTNVAGTWPEGVFREEWTFVSTTSREAHVQYAVDALYGLMGGDVHAEVHEHNKAWFEAEEKYRVEKAK